MDWDWERNQTVTSVRTKGRFKKTKRKKETRSAACASVCR